MSDFIKTRVVRGRKQHICDLCGFRIRRGANHVMGSGVHDDRPFRVRYHEVCLSKTEWWDYSDWEVSSGQYAEFRKYELGLPLVKDDGQPAAASSVVPREPGAIRGALPGMRRGAMPPVGLVVEREI